MNKVALTEIDLDGRILSVTIPNTFFDSDLLPKIGDNIFDYTESIKNETFQRYLETARESRIPIQFSINIQTKTLAVIVHFLSEKGFFVYWNQMNPVENNLHQTVHTEWEGNMDRLSIKNKNENSEIESILIKLTDNLPIVVFEIHLFPDGKFNFGFVNNEMRSFFPDFDKEAVNQIDF